LNWPEIWAPAWDWKGDAFSKDVGDGGEESFGNRTAGKVPDGFGVDD
jgi:hypothetical protein